MLYAGLDPSRQRLDVHIEAATHAARHAQYANRYERTKQRLDRQRGSRSAEAVVDEGHAWGRRTLGAVESLTRPGPG
jgi:hypothetical protein